MAQSIVEAWFRAMRRGRDGEAELLGLFTDDARYTEPFSGKTHHGKSAISAYLRGAWETTPPELTLTIDRVDVEGERATARWCCNSPAFERPIWGEDRYLVREGKICELVTAFIDTP